MSFSVTRNADVWTPNKEGVFYGLNSTTYHKSPGISNSMLLKAETPLRLKCLLENKEVEETTEDQIIGTICHSLTLTPNDPLPGIRVIPEKYPAPADSSLVKSKKVAAGDLVAWSGNATYCKEWMRTSVEEGFVPVTQEGKDNMLRTSSALLADPCFREWVQESDTEVSCYGVRFPKDPHSLLRCRIDMVPSNNYLADVKTIHDASDSTLQSKWSDHWAMQAAYYLDLWNQLNPDDQRSGFRFFVVEKGTADVRYSDLTHAIYQYGRERYLARLLPVLKSMKTGVWPGWGKTPFLAEVKPWMMAKEAS